MITGISYLAAGCQRCVIWAKLFECYRYESFWLILCNSTRHWGLNMSIRWSKKSKPQINSTERTTRIKKSRKIDEAMNSLAPLPRHPLSTQPRPDRLLLLRHFVIYYCTKYETLSKLTLMSLTLTWRDSVNSRTNGRDCWIGSTYSLNQQSRG
jgi:hypothetical protein